jgi:ribonuclease BN (tRNA processing enzyme)
VRVTLLPSSIGSHGSDELCQYLITYLFNETLAIDAGSLGLYGSPAEQSRVRHVLISHTHIDHTATLPIFVENAYEARSDCVTIHAGAEVLEGIQRDMFNDRIWPDFVELSRGHVPFLNLNPIEPFQPIDLEGLTITPVPVDHVVPTLGFVVTQADRSVVIASDTGPTEDLWRAANRAPGLAAVFLEASFPNELLDLATISKHLTPELFGQEVAKLERSALVIAVHLKARYRERIVAELRALGLPKLEIATPGTEYVF